MREPKIIIGYNPTFEPFAWQENGQAKGQIIDKCRALLASTKWSVEFVPLGLKDMIAALHNGHVDALVGLAASPEREDKLLFSAPLVWTGGAWFSLKETVWPSDNALKASGQGKYSVVTPGKGPLVAPIKEQFPELRLETCQNYEDALEMVLNGQADAAALNFQVGSRLAEKSFPDRITLPSKCFFDVGLAIATTQKDRLGLMETLLQRG